MENKQPQQKTSALALLPFLIFIAIYLGAGIFMTVQGQEMAFYQFPSVVAIFIAVLVAFCLKKGSINEKFAVFARGAGNENIITMLVIFVLAGAFSAVAGATGGVDAVVNLGLSLVPAQFITAGVFVISAFLGVATGTSMGTIGAIVPIALGVADKAGLNLPLVIAACVGGAMFGDNLSMISDTTISATRTQGCELRDKFKVNFMIALPAAVLTIILLLVFGAPVEAVPLENLTFDIVKVIPYLLVLVLALCGMNVFLVLTIGIFSAGIIGLGAGDLTIFTFAQNIWDGFKNMNEVFFLSFFIGGLAALTAHYGGINWLIGKVRKLIRGPKSAQLGMAGLVSVADLAVANNTVAIIITGPIAKDISREYKVDPRRSASILDIFSCVFQGIVPYGAQLLLVGSLTAGALSPVDVLPFLWYQQLLAVFAILSIFLPFADWTYKKDPWNWEYDVAQSGVEAKKLIEQETAE
ncbi:Na+/H+ antiporter NhaC family protein [Candidatus Soleaferrea massiliensis]|uniref:Na+/H+ antiporter NhaC family protein n=1 Tax=Candidatus Soleaferrea massiliensis TaxID=1470354 RepID=UPI0006950138|nr:Na+/H+ antiporter NhaC family protein [Candidatus Soleaferrea massiliensis]